jgi:SAM-dependent methyltransferase
VIFENRHCPVCGSADDSLVFAESNFDEDRLNRYSFASRKVPELMHYRLVRCRQCGLLYASPAPSSDDLKTAYNEASYDSAAESRDASRTYIRQLDAVLPKLPDLAGALDIGAGDGAFLERLLEVGFSDVVGIEPSEAPITAACPDVRDLIRRGIFSAVDYKPESFRLITCFQTVEHLNDPAAVCAASYNLLKSPGVFFVIAHNYLSLSAKILGLKSPIFDIEHLQLFSPESMRYMLKQAGFEKVTVYPIANSYPLHYWIKMLPLAASPKEKIISFIKAVGLNRFRLPLWAGNMAAIGYKAS